MIERSTLYQLFLVVMYFFPLIAFRSIAPTPLLFPQEYLFPIFFATMLMYLHVMELLQRFANWVDRYDDLPISEVISKFRVDEDGISIEDYPDMKNRAFDDPSTDEPAESINSSTYKISKQSYKKEIQSETQRSINALNEVLATNPTLLIKQREQLQGMNFDLISKSNQFLLSNGLSVFFLSLMASILFVHSTPEITGVLILFFFFYLMFHNIVISLSTGKRAFAAMIRGYDARQLFFAVLVMVSQLGGYYIMREDVLSGFFIGSFTFVMLMYSIPIQLRYPFLGYMKPISISMQCAYKHWFISFGYYFFALIYVWCILGVFGDIENPTTTTASALINLWPYSKATLFFYYLSFLPVLLIYTLKETCAL
eukprot:TRINITY_DN2318_c0_g1_i1.p1 TRINITY_DN2318_c0_g1~~TRINITY_DN2318_c0_g1_i1.p1  ORF type:complete len:384 (-),score=61.86 TRINITY_DN2318_c0_g1_i1:4-1110(-)